MDTKVREVWTGCAYCLNPRHPGPCADRVVDDAEPAAVVVAAARSRRIRGLDDDRLAAWEDRAETAMAAALAEVMDAIADRIAHAAGVASAREPWTGCSHCLSPKHPGSCRAAP